MSNRRQFLKTMAMGGMATMIPRVVSGQSPVREKPGRPLNVLFILVDDLGWGDLACYGNGIVKTPNIDRLAAQGLRFTNFYVNAPVCSPTRAGFMTGLFPSRLGIYGHFAKEELNERRGMPQSMDPEVPTVADLFKKAGYTTAHFGKWHLGTAPAQEYGFDISKTFAGGGPFAWENEDHFWRNSSECIVDAAIAFLKEHRDKPFYANVWTFHPHAPLDPSPEQMAPYDRFNDKRLKGEFTTPFAVFYGVVTELDRQIGRLLDTLDELELSENTLVLFSSANGPEDIHLPETAHSGVGTPGPFRGRKRSLYEGGIRTPFMVRWPGKTPPGKVDRTTVLSGVDFLPSICCAAGVPVSEPLHGDGENLAEALQGTPANRKKPLFWEFRSRVLGDVMNRNPRMVIRDANWKLLMNPDRSRIELYDIPNDPMEVDNVADNHPDVVSRLADKLLAWDAELPEAPVEPEAGNNAYPWP